MRCSIVVPRALVPHLLLLLAFATALQAHVVSMSSGELKVDGTSATFELRIPMYEVAHVTNPQTMLLEQLKSGPHAGSVDWSRVDTFRPFGGIRIEDDVVCTDAEPMNLTRDGFAELA